jgi:hypothetical protein
MHICIIYNIYYIYIHIIAKPVMHENLVHELIVGTGEGSHLRWGNAVFPV